jgi:hypothetical protein
MMKSLRITMIIVGFCCCLPLLRAQAVYTATRSGRIQAGAGLLYLNNDYTVSGDQGASIWVDGDLNRFLGLEVEAHLGTIRSPQDIGENSYLIGPRLSLHRGRFTPYAKLMVGRGTIVNDFRNTSSSYNLFAYGGGVDYRFHGKFSWRAVDFELQNWHGFPPNGLTPYAISSGVMYKIR